MSDPCARPLPLSTDFTSLIFFTEFSCWIFPFAYQLPIVNFAYPDIAKIAFDGLSERYIEV